MPVRIAELRILAVAHRVPEIERERSRSAHANLRGDIANAGAIEVMHAETSETTAFAHGDDEIHRGQAAAERSLDDGRIELQAPGDRGVIPHATKVIAGTPPARYLPLDRYPPKEAPCKSDGDKM